jgi:hypothetical protein
MRIGFSLYLILSFLFTGCSSIVSQPYKPPSESVDLSGRGLVWVYYEKPGLDVRMKAVEIYVDNQSVGYVKANGYALLSLRPGKRTVQVVMRHNYPLPDKSRDGPSYDIPVSIGKQVVFKFDWKFDDYEEDRNLNIATYRYKVPTSLTTTIPESLYKANLDLSYTEK